MPPIHDNPACLIGWDPSLRELRFRSEPTLAGPPAAPGRRNVAVRLTLRTLRRRATVSAAAVSDGRRDGPAPVATSSFPPLGWVVALAAVAWRMLLRRLTRPSVSPRIIFLRGGRLGAAASDSEVRWRPEVVSVCEP